MKPTVLLLALLALPVLAPAAAAPPTATLPARATTRVEGTFVVPKDLPAFAGRVAEIRLYQTDPRVADRPATLVEMLTVPDVGHVADSETSRPFVIGASGTLDPTATYYVTLFLLVEGKRTHIGEGDHSKNNLCKVLTAGQPSSIVMRLREVKTN
jgi:hypothetical protein